MKIDWLFKDEILKLLDFNDDTGKYEKEIGDFRIEINSWNNKLFIKEKGEMALRDISTDFIKIILEIDRIKNIEFEEELNENNKDN